MKKFEEDCMKFEVKNAAHLVDLERKLNKLGFARGEKDNGEAKTIVTYPSGEFYRIYDRDHTKLGPDSLSTMDDLYEKLPPKTGVWIKFKDQRPPTDTQILVYCPRAQEGYIYNIVKVDKYDKILAYDRKEDEYTVYQAGGYSAWGITHWMLHEKPKD